jgi:uncharacterized protein (TIGR02449 family)
MSDSSTLDQLADKLERLLVRHEELQRTNQLLSLQLETVSAERDSLKSRLAAARARVDALIDRLPASATDTTSSAQLDQRKAA